MSDALLKAACQKYLLGGHLELQELGLSTQDVPGSVDLQEPHPRNVGLMTGSMGLFPHCTEELLWALLTLHSDSRAVS